MFTKKFRKSLFPKGVFISLEERTLASIYRSNHQKCSIKKGVLRNFTTFTGKHLSQSLLFNKVAGLGTPFLQITSGHCFCIYLLGNYDWGVDISLQKRSGELFFKGVYIYGETSSFLPDQANFELLNSLLCIGQ